jgi:hypothetical protein
VTVKSEAEAFIDEVARQAEADVMAVFNRSGVTLTSYEIDALKTGIFCAIPVTLNELHKRGLLR